MEDSNHDQIRAMHRSGTGTKRMIEMDNIALEAGVDVR
jgi:hypothetical protein